MATSQNGWPALPADSRKLHTWVIPAKTGTIRLRMRNGSAGLILAHLALWLAETVEPLAGGIMDDWGHAWRAIRGYVTGLSNHAAGCAFDANATKHPLGVRGTWSAKKAHAIRARLHWKVYAGCIRWGEDYTNRKDGMHFEIVKPLATCERVAKVLCKTPRGKRLLAANPGQRAVIYS